MLALTLLTTALVAVASAANLPSELSAIGNSSQVLNVTFQLSSSQLVEVYPGHSLSTDGK